MTDLTAKLERAIIDMGDSPDAIAAFLEGQGIRARAGLRSQNCPIAVYLQRLVGHRVSVNWTTANNSAGRWLDHEPYWSVQLTPAAREFTHRADGGRYPRLEAKR